MSKVKANFNKDDFEKTLDTKSEKMSDKDQKKLIYMKNRLTAMEEVRSKYETRWKEQELQVRAAVPQRNDGKAAVNLPMEQNIIEQKLGEKKNSLAFIIEPNGDNADSNILEPIKYTMDYFIKEEGCREVINDWKYEKSTYGHGILFSGVWSEIRKFNKALEEDTNPDTEDNGVDNEFYGSKFEEVTERIWHIGLKNIDIWDFWIDEKAKKIEDAMDCFIREDISIEELRIRFGKETGFKYIYSVGVRTKESPSYAEKDDISTRNVELMHYYNKITGVYCIMANKQWVIYNGKNVYAHGELPVSTAKEYPSLKSFYGLGVPDKTLTSKPYINNLYQYALDKIQLGSGSVLLAGNGETVDGEMYIEPGEITEWNFTGDIKNVQQMSFDSNTTGIQNVIQLMEDVNIQNTGINTKAPFSSPSKTAFEAGLQEQAKNSRLSVPDLLEDICIDRALNLMMSNIMQFAPGLYANKIMNKDEPGKVQSIEYKKITIPDVEVINQGKDKPTKIKRKVGEFGVFEMRPEDIRGQVSLRLSTPGTRTLLQALEKESFTSYINNLANLAQINPEVLQKVDTQGLYDKMNMIYGIDGDKTKARTETIVRREKAKAIIDTIQNMGTGKPIQPDNNPGGTPFKQIPQDATNPMANLTK